METKVVPAHGIELHTVAVGGLRGKGWKARLLAPLMLLRALLASLALLRRLRPRSVLSMGGYVAGPGGLAAWLLRRPLLVLDRTRGVLGTRGSVCLESGGGRMSEKKLNIKKTK